ncbi:MAG: Imm52 family immunity protein [Mucilaginibacter sp.]
MEYNDIIRVVSRPQAQSIIERAKYIVQKQSLISAYLNKSDWYLFDKTPVDIRQQEQVSQLILKRIKKRIKAHTTIKDVPDDFLDNVSTIDGFYASKKFDSDSVLIFNIGNTKSSSLVIEKAKCFERLNDFKELKKFIINLVEIFEPKYVEVFDYVFYNDLMDLKSDEYRFGWMTYFSKDIKIPELPADIKVEELPNGGRLLITTEDTFTCENSEHVRKAKLLVDLFRKNNIKC